MTITLQEAMKRDKNIIEVMTSANVPESLLESISDVENGLVEDLNLD